MTSFKVLGTRCTGLRAAVQRRKRRILPFISNGQLLQRDLSINTRVTTYIT